MPKKLTATAVTLLGIKREWQLLAHSPREAGEVERAIAAFTRTPNGGLITTSSALAVVRRDLIIGLAARYKLPAVYHRQLFAATGGLISYGPEIIDQLHHTRLATSTVSSKVRNRPNPQR